MMLINGVNQLNNYLKNALDFLDKELRTRRDNIIDIWVNHKFLSYLIELNLDCVTVDREKNKVYFKDKELELKDIKECVTIKIRGDINEQKRKI